MKTPRQLGDPSRAVPAAGRPLQIVNFHAQVISGGGWFSGCGTGTRALNVPLPGAERLFALRCRRVREHEKALKAQEFQTGGPKEHDDLR